MSNDIAIKIENLSKRYVLGNVRSGSLRATLQNYWQSLRGTSSKEEEFWALDDVSLEIKHGEVLGIIGRNGAGKSTLLKILSRITPPTKGRIELNGRVASLLEVGTGFHPELTGRENIFMNGSLLGMTRREILQKLDEIVDFSGIERFLDTPVKRYSSGMYVRLAFAVAAHLEPEILLIDEVLAVGDTAFQKKCLGKMNDVAESGKTVIFVSHDMGAIDQLCTKCSWIEQGRLQLIASPEKVINTYLQSLKDSVNQLNPDALRKGNGSIKIKAILIQNKLGEPVDFFQSGKDYQLVIELKNTTDTDFNMCRLDIRFDKIGQQRMAWLSTWLEHSYFSSFANSNQKLRIVLPKFPLMPGIYALTLHLVNETGIADQIRDAIHLQVDSGPFYTSRRMPPPEQTNFLIEHQFYWDELPEKS